MSEKLTHYRRVFKSDHLGVADLEEMIEEGKKLVFTIVEVKQYMKDPSIKGSGVKVAGKLISANVAFFKEDIKPLVINSKNSKPIKAFTGSGFVEHWKEVPVELYIDPTVKYAGELTGGVRIRDVQPKLKAKKVFTEANIKAAKDQSFTLDQVKEFYDVSPEMEIKFNEYEAT